MILQVLEDTFAVCKFAAPPNPPADARFWFYSKTDEEISLVCAEHDIPKDCPEANRGWRGFRIKGTLDFSLTGILARISAVLAAERIGIFAVSTYDTDYIFVKSENLGHALRALKAGGYEVEEGKTA